MPPKKRRKRADHPRRPTILRRDVDSTAGLEQQPMIQGLRRAMHQDDPLDLLMSVSQLVASTEKTGPLAPAPPVSLAELVEIFEAVDLAPTTAALHMLALLAADDLLSTRIQRTLQQRRQPMPPWLSGLAEAHVVRVRESRHVQRDGEDYLLDVRIPGTRPLTALVYVDNNMNGIVKDAFLIGEPLDVVEAKMHEIEDRDTTWADVDLASARALIEDALAHGAIVHPPPESDTWPGCRPAIRWLVGLLPAGGTIPQEHEWSEAETGQLVESFLASPGGTPYDDRDGRRLLDDLTRFGTSQATGDPTRWSPVNVETLMLDWFPRKVVAEPLVLLRLPGLLRAFVRYCHARQGLRPDLTAETVTAVDRWELDYRNLVLTEDRPQGAEALVRALLDDVVDWNQDVDLASEVGSEDALATLDDEPLPDEPFDWTGIAEDIRPMVAEVLALCDENADDLLDVEHRTANRRLLRRVAMGDPGAFRGRGAARTAAAAVCWMVARANRSTSSYGPLTNGQLLAPFGVTTATRASRFRRAIGLKPVLPTAGPIPLGSPDFLVSARRRSIIEEHAELGG